MSVWVTKMLPFWSAATPLGVWNCPRFAPYEPHSKRYGGGDSARAAGGIINRQATSIAVRERGVLIGKLPRFGQVDVPRRIHGRSVTYPEPPSSRISPRDHFVCR